MECKRCAYEDCIKFSNHTYMDENHEVSARFMSQHSKQDFAKRNTDKKCNSLHLNEIFFGFV